jgi:predicted kinase
VGRRAGAGPPTLWDMTAPLVVLVSGAPGTGKTALLRELAPRLGLPVIAKDDIKESLGDTLGTSDLAWSKRLGAATWELLFLLYEKLLEGGTSFIAESNFSTHNNQARFRSLMERFPFVPVEVYCFTDHATIAERLRGRQARRERHAVHHSAEFEATVTDEQIAELLPPLGHVPLDLSEHVLRVDTSGPEPLDLDGIVTYIRGVADGL